MIKRFISRYRIKTYRVLSCIVEQSNWSDIAIHWGYRDSKKAQKMSVDQKWLQIESPAESLSSNKSTKAIEENVEKCELQFEESGADIDEIFMKLYGKPGEPVRSEEQRRIVDMENARRKRAERISSESREDGNMVGEGGSIVFGMVLIDEGVIKQDHVIFGETEIDWDVLFATPGSSDSKPTETASASSFFSCTVL